MYIKRKIEDKIFKYLKTPEIIAVIGPRQAGKSTTINEIFSHLENKSIVNFNDKKILNLFVNDIESFREIYVNKFSYVFIDEFQYAKNGGKNLKYIFDKNKEENLKVKIFISGSSAVDISVQAIKYLVGRIFVFNLFALDFEEFLSYRDANLLSLVKKSRADFAQLKRVDIGSDAEEIVLKYFYEYIIYGGYPRVCLAEGIEEKKEVLKNIYNTYFLREVRDILGLIEDFKLEKLIKGLALQVGNLISYDELGVLSEYSFPTLKKYLNFLEKTYICSYLRPFFKNKRLEIVKNPKVYFFDSGLRNYIVDDFRPVDSRGDIGAVLENYVFMEFTKSETRFNYWRTKQGQELDFIIHREGGQELAVEIKNNYKETPKAFGNIKKLYPDMNLAIASVYDNSKNQNNLRYPLFAIS